MGDDQHPATGATAHLFAPIRAPRITSISRKAIQDFLADRESYEDSVAAQPGLKAVSWRSCFQASFLRSLVLARMFGTQVKDVSDLTDEIIKDKLSSYAEGSKVVSADEALSDVKRNVRMDASERDARIRIMMLSASYLGLCYKRGWKFVFKAPKAAIGHIISVLQPPRLKQRVGDALELEHADLAEDYYGFMDFLSDKAVIFEEVQPLREHRVPQKPSRDKGRGPDMDKTPAPSTKNKTPPPSKPRGKPPPCLNPKCDEDHLVKDCPNTSKELARTLLESYRASKTNRDRHTQVSALVVPVEEETSEPQGNGKNDSTDTTAVIDAEIGGYNFACRIDSGADLVVISDTIISFLGDKGIFLPIVLPTKKVTFKSVDGHPVHSPGIAEVSPLLQTIAGPCRLRNIRAHIMADKDDCAKPGNACAGELVLGNPFLIRSGLNVKDFVANNLSHLASIDYGELQREEAPSKVGKLGFKILSRGVSTDDTPIFPNGILFSPGTPRPCSMLANGDFPLKDGDDIDYKDVDIGEQDEDELQSALDGLTSRAFKNLPKHLRRPLNELVQEFKDIFRTRLGADPPVDVPPMDIELVGPERPVKVRQRTYSPQQSTFLKEKVDELVRAGYIYRNVASKWACAPLVVPKPGKEGFRFTVDLRPVDAQTKKNVWPMPLADQMLAKLTGSKVWFKLDFIHGYWQFPLAEDSQESQSFHTPFGVYTPKRILHGATNSGSYFQSSMEFLFSHLELLIYIDELLGYAKDATHLLDKRRSVFTICLEKGLKINPAKCELVAFEVQFCGRIINKDGVKFHPRQ